MSKEKQNQKKILNRRAKYDYEIHSQIETGVILNGNEVKSIRFGKVVLDNAYAIIKKGEIWMMNMFIDLKHLNKKIDNLDNLRPKKLLLKKKEIAKISQSLKNNNFTMIPLNLHFNKKGFVKIDLAISKGRKKADKREYKKDQDWKREKERLLKK
ncbi:MAG: SsrA-binding protein [Alphaproteobacteria bacterium]|nr:SsrA-binding protein [Alphaproteobacteria bacterium]